MLKNAGKNYEKFILIFLRFYLFKLVDLELQLLQILDHRAVAGAGLQNPHAPRDPDALVDLAERREGRRVLVLGAGELGEPVQVALLRPAAVPREVGRAQALDDDDVWKIKKKSWKNLVVQFLLSNS